MTPDHLLPQTALDWHKAGRKVAVAVVVETWGSAPRGTGSWLVIDENATMAGSVSGGCVEGAVITEACEAMEDGLPRLLDYGVSDDEAFAVGLACGGRIRVLVDVVGASLPLDVLQNLATKAPIVYIADLTNNARSTAAPATYPDRFRLDRSGIDADGITFVGIHNPPLRMIIIGAVHIAQTLVQTARSCGFTPILIDPRGAFGSKARFPAEDIIDDWPDAAMDVLQPDARTAVVTLTHDPKLDDPAILSALKTDAFYIGCLGSTRTHAKRVARLEDAGVAAQDIARISAPVGLDIGGRAPSEIAVSIMAEVIQNLRKTL